MKRRLQKIFSYLSGSGPSAEEGTRQIQLGVHPEGSTAGAGGVSGEEWGRRKARETEVEKELVPVGLAAAPACLVTDQQKPGGEVRGAALPCFSVYSLHHPSKSPLWPQELWTTVTSRKPRFSLWAFTFDSINFQFRFAGFVQTCVLSLLLHCGRGDHKEPGQVMWPRGWVCQEMGKLPSHPDHLLSLHVGWACRVWSMQICESFIWSLLYCCGFLSYLLLFFPCCWRTFCCVF